jgi:hypothetical protein
MSKQTTVGSILANTSNSHKAQLSETKGIVTKWNRTGLLEGLSNEYEKHGMAILLENQAKQLIDEASRTGTASNSEEWSGVALPLVRRVFAEIAAKEFVSVQPMNLPSGLIFYLDYKYGTDNGTGFTTNSGKDSQKDSVFGETNTTGDPTQGLYGSGRYGYSINMASSSKDLTGVTGSLEGIDFNFNTVFSQSYAGQFHGGVSLGGGVNQQSHRVYTVLMALSEVTENGGTNGRYDLDAVKSWKLTNNTDGVVVENFNEFTKLTNAAGVEVAPDSATHVQFIASGSGVTAAIDDTFQVTFPTKPTDVTRGDFEDDGAARADGIGGVAADIAIPEINLEMKSIAIVAKTRKLKAVWTPEFAQDLNAYHSIDAEAELTSMLSEYISQEIDLEILDMLMNNALVEENWSVTIGEKYDGNSVFATANTGEAYNQGTWFQTLGTKIQKVSNKIHAKTMRGGANWLVCSPDVATILESIPGYAADTDGNQSSFAMGVQKVGQLANRFTVYKNPYIQSNTILMGFRGNQFLETGAVYAPYVPLIMTPLIYDPTNFTPRKGVMTRYAKRIVRPEFYGKINVRGLHTL